MTGVQTCALPISLWRTSLLSGHNVDSLFEVSTALVTPQWRSDWCAKLSQEEAGSLTNIPSDGEIWNALKSMKPYKSPGVDGLHVGFF